MLLLSMAKKINPVCPQTPEFKYSKLQFSSMAVNLTEDASIIGRSEHDIERYGDRATAYLGKSVLSSGERPVLGRKLLIDIAKPHLMLVCGKRGGGKSYSLAVLIEEFARQPIDVRQRIGVVVIDPVGIFWTLKIPTKEGVDELNKWDLKPDKTDIRFLVPRAMEDFYKKKELPYDGVFTLRVSELEAAEWMTLFNVTWKDAEGVLISRVIETVKEKLGNMYGLDELAIAAKNDSESEKSVRESVSGRFVAAKGWGLFEKEGTKIRDIAKAGSITIIDVSAYRQAVGMEGARDIIVGLIGKRLFEERMLFRKEEEVRLTKGLSRSSEMPIIWMMIDEAHMFMPKDEKSIALSVLLEWVRVGRQPGLSLVLATQRPNKLHPDCISQCDLFLSHRMTAREDIEAVSQLRPSYLHQDFDKYYQEMPRSKGYAILLDDQTEKLWLMKVRPRFSWDGGVTASVFRD